MFDFFKIKRPNSCPLNEENRICIEKSFLFLLNLFGKENTQCRKIITPHKIHFPINYDLSEQSAHATLQIVAKQMEVSFVDIVLDFYDERLQFITEGQPQGLYFGKNDAGKYEISLSRGSLSEPEKMVATLAHEIAHIKLLDEKQLPFNDEKITDLTTIFFGLGIFNANEALQTSNRGWNALGYLSQMEWGYALSLFAYIRNEVSPKWIEHLTPNVKGDFIQGQNFIITNEELILKNLP